MSDQQFAGAAYEDLLAAAMYGHSLSEAQKLVADLVHELAEKIREDAQSRHDRDFSDNRVFRLTGAQHAADLIDPEVP